MSRQKDRILFAVVTDTLRAFADATIAVAAVVSDGSCFRYWASMTSVASAATAAAAADTSIAAAAAVEEVRHAELAPTTEGPQEARQGLRE